MSLQKRKTKKCLSNSLSEVSNTENLRQSIIFKNDVLCDIRNLSGPEDKNAKKAQKSHYECKRRAERSNESKTYNYAAVCKMIEEKNILIADQEKQLDNLKGTLEKARRELQRSKTQSEKKRVEDLAVLKKQELDNGQNIKELDILRTGLKHMKQKNQALEASKEKVTKRNTKLLEENEELTVKLNAMKEECSMISVDEKTINDLKYEIQVLKEQSRVQKELESQKTVLEQRYQSMERKLNQYIVKYNNIQSKFNDSQIKFYKAQKENDDLKLTNQELEGETQNYCKLLEEERTVLKEQTAKWKERIEKLEEHHKIEKSEDNNHGFRAIFTQLEKKYHKLQCKSDFESRIMAKEEQIMAFKLEFCNKLTDKDNELIQTNQKLDKAKLKIEEISKNYELQLTEARQTLQMQKHEQDKSKQILQYQYQASLKTQKEQFDKQIGLKDTYISQLQVKSQELVTENQRINNIYKQLNQNIRKQNEQNYLSVSRALDDKNYENSKLLLSIQQYKKSLQTLQSEKSDCSARLLKLEQQISCNSKAHNQKQCVILNKMTVLEQQLTKKQAFYLKQLKSKNQQIQQLSKTLQQTNNELISIKTAIKEYKLQIQTLKSQVQQSDVQIVNCRTENQCILNQQISSLRKKYEQIFQHNIQLSEKFCEIQKQHTVEINKHTELMRRNSELESEIKRIHITKQETHKALTEQLSILEHEKWELRGKVQQKQNERKQCESKFRELELASKNQESAIQQYEEQLRIKQQNKELEWKWEVQRSKLMNQLSTLEFKWKDELHQKERVNLCHREEVVGLEGRIDQLQALIRQKQNIILQNYQVISSKEQEINRLSNFTKVSQNQQCKEMKDHNAQLTSKLQEITGQFNRAHQELRQVSEQASKYRSTINQLEKHVNNSKKKTIELENQNAELQRQKYSDHDQSNEEKRRFKQVIMMLQEKIKNIECEKIGYYEKYQGVNRELKKVQNEYNKMSRSMLDESNRRNKQNGRQFDNYRSQIKILKEENLQLQSLMDKELNKRKSIIEELIQQKKVLYEQISRH